jgi:hypothetical protein
MPTRSFVTGPILRLFYFFVPDFEIHDSRRFRLSASLVAKKFSFASVSDPVLWRKRHKHFLPIFDSGIY